MKDKTPAKTYKAKKMIVSAEMLLNIGKGKFEIFADVQPADIKLLTASCDKETKVIELIIESATFPEVSSLENLETVIAPVIARIE